MGNVVGAARCARGFYKASTRRKLWLEIPTGCNPQQLARSPKRGQRGRGMSDVRGKLCRWLLQCGDEHRDVDGASCSACVCTWTAKASSTRCLVAACRGGTLVSEMWKKPRDLRPRRTRDGPHIRSRLLPMLLIAAALPSRREVLSRRHS